MKNKKKIIALFLAAVSILMLYACNSEESPPPGGAPTFTFKYEPHSKFGEDVSLSSHSDRDILPYSEGFPDVLAAKYEIDGRQLYHIKHGVMVMYDQNTAHKFHITVENPDCVLYNQNGDILEGDDLITTGSYVEYKGKDGFKIVILCDLNGDGKTDDTDISEMKKYIGNTPETAESDLKFLAADVNDSGNVTQYDIDRITGALSKTRFESDLIHSEAPLDTNEPSVDYDYLSVTIKSEDFKKTHKSKKFYGEEVDKVVCNDIESVTPEMKYYSVDLYLDRDYSPEELRKLRSRIELLEGVYVVEYSRGGYAGPT